MRTGWQDFLKTVTLVLGRHRYGFPDRATVLLFPLVLGTLLPVAVRGDWQDHEIRQGDGRGDWMARPAQRQAAAVFQP